MEGQIKLSNEDTNEEEYSVSILMNFPQCSNSTNQITFFFFRLNFKLSKVTMNLDL